MVSCVAAPDPDNTPSHNLLCSLISLWTNLQVVSSFHYYKSAEQIMEYFVRWKVHERRENNRPNWQCEPALSAHY